MRYILISILLLSLLGCAGTGFFLNQEPAHQIVTIARGDQSLDLKGQVLLKDNVFRGKFYSDFFRGNAQIVFENGEFDIDYESLPLDDEKLGYLKGDLYAAFFAGGYPYKADKKMYGEVTTKSGKKFVKDTDGYTLYEVLYNNNEIRIHNLVHEYFIIIQTEKKLK